MLCQPVYKVGRRVAGEGLAAAYVVGDVWSGITYVSSHLAHDADVLIAVEKCEFLIAHDTGS